MVPRHRNVPVPEPHVAGLVIGIGLDWVRPWPLPTGSAPPTVVGAAVIAVGLAVVGWAVMAVGSSDVNDPEALVTDGPYRYSRNPMYVGWTAGYLGVALLADAAWPLVLLPAVAGLTHRTVRREERRLAERFDDDYAAYRERVRRYL